MNKVTYFIYNTYNQKCKQSLNLFWIGFVLYSFLFSLTSSPATNQIITQGFQIIGIGLMAFGFMNIMQFSIHNSYLRTLFILFCLWSLFVFIRANDIDYNYIKSILFDGWYGIFSYFVPMIILIPKKLLFYKKLFQIILILGILGLLLDLYFARELLDPDINNFESQAILEVINTTLCLSAGFILLTYKYHSRKSIIIALMVIGGTVFFAIFRARRAMILMNVIPLLIAYFIYVYNSKAKYKIWIILFSIAVTVIVTNYFIQIYYSDQHFENIQKKSFENTRTGVEECFFRDMTRSEFIMGKGLNGQYYCPGIDQGTVSMYRSVIETGYLNMILKGGVIYMGLWLLIALPAIYYGFFRSKNTLSKAGAIWIFLFLLFHYPTTVNTFTLHYFIFWIAIDICYSRQLRVIPEEILQSYLKK